MSHYHTGHADGLAVERGEKVSYNPELITDPGYRNGLRAGREAVIDARIIAWKLDLVTVEIAGKPTGKIHHMKADDIHERLPICGAGGHIATERLVASEKRDATCKGCLGEARAWFQEATK